MPLFDLKTMKSYPYEERDKNVFYKAKEFKARIDKKNRKIKKRKKTSSG